MDKFMENLKKEIVDYLGKNGKSTLDDIHKDLNSDQLGLTYRDINDAIRELKSNGQIQEYTYYGLRPSGCAKMPNGKTIKKAGDFFKPSSDN